MVGDFAGKSSSDGSLSNRAILRDDNNWKMMDSPLSNLSSSFGGGRWSSLPPFAHQAPPSPHKLGCHWFANWIGIAAAPTRRFNSCWITVVYNQARRSYIWINYNLGSVMLWGFLRCSLMLKHQFWGWGSIHSQQCFHWLKYLTMYRISIGLSIIWFWLTRNMFQSRSHYQITTFYLLLHFKITPLSDRAHKGVTVDPWMISRVFTLYGTSESSHCFLWDIIRLFWHPIELQLVFFFCFGKTNHVHRKRAYLIIFMYYCNPTHIKLMHPT